MAAFHVTALYQEHFDGHCAAAFEHGQWFVTCFCGASWSVNDLNDHEYSFEEVSHGNEDYHDDPMD
jgi:hypothetical protein